ncbi:hypothetical protein Tco_1376367, partial [Tanacetum coccineum]
VDRNTFVLLAGSNPDTQRNSFPIREHEWKDFWFGHRRKSKNPFKSLNSSSSIKSRFQGTDISLKDKNKAKIDKTKHKIKKSKEDEAEGARGVEIRLTVEIAGVVPIEGFCWVFASRDENSSIDAPNLNSFDLPNIFSHPSQP